MNAKSDGPVETGPFEARQLCRRSLHTRWRYRPASFPAVNTGSPFSTSDYPEPLALRRGVVAQIGGSERPSDMTTGMERLMALTGEDTHELR